MKSGDFEGASMKELAEEVVEQIISAAHYESKGNGEMRRHCRNEAIGALTEILTRRVTVSTNLFSKD